MRMVQDHVAGDAGGMIYLFLLIAIVGEVVGTSALKASDGFTRPAASAVTIVGYGFAFYFLSLTLATVPVGIVYALWSGLGIVLVALVGLVWFGQMPDRAAIVGLALIVAGVTTIGLFSSSGGH